MIFNFSLQPHPSSSQIPLLPDSCDSWEETIYIRLANKTTTPAVSPVLTADIWNTPELLQLSKCSLTRNQVTFGLILLGRGWLGIGQSLWVPQNCNCISTCVSACPSLHTPKLPVCHFLQYSVTGCVCKGLSSSQVPILSQWLLCTHPVTMCWFYVLCPYCLRISSCWADSELQQGMAGRWGKETPASVAQHGNCHPCPLLPKQTSSFLWGRCSDQEAVVYSWEAEGKETWPPCQKLFLLT